MRFLLFFVVAVGWAADSGQLAKIAGRMRELVEQKRIAGTVTLFQQKGELVHFEAVGWQDIENKKPMRKDSIFQIMSMTKPFTGTAIMMLAEAGRLSVSDPVEKHLPEFRGQMLQVQGALKKPARPITIHDLMTHTSGLPSAPPPGIGELYQKLDRVLADAVLVFSQQPLDFEPGSKWSYSNQGIATLGRIIEVASGKPFADFMEERLFEPLGMTNTTFWPSPDHLDVLAKPYSKSKDSGELVEAKNSRFSEPLHDSKRTALASGGLYSCAKDLGKLCQMLLNEGTLDGMRTLKAATLKQMTSNQLGDLAKVSFAPGMHMGLGFHIVNAPQEVTESLSAGTYGHGGAFGTQAWIDPVKKRAYVLLIQRTDLKNSDQSEIRREFQKAASEAYAR